MWLGSTFEALRRHEEHSFKWTSSSLNISFQSSPDPREQALQPSLFSTSYFRFNFREQHSALQVGEDGALQGSDQDAHSSRDRGWGEGAGSAKATAPQTIMHRSPNHAVHFLFHFIKTLTKKQESKFRHVLLGLESLRKKSLRIISFIWKPVLEKEGSIFC